MRLPERGEKGFTLIELLIVVAILGVLAAVVIPNVGRFIGRGETEAAATELSNLQSAVIAMMIDQGLETLGANITASATNDMTMFPDKDVNGSSLYGFGGSTINYLATNQTQGTYTVNAQGTVTQVTTGYE